MYFLLLARTPGLKSLGAETRKREDTLAWSEGMDSLHLPLWSYNSVSGCSPHRLDERRTVDIVVFVLCLRWVALSRQRCWGSTPGGCHPGQGERVMSWTMRASHCPKTPANRLRLDPTSCRLLGATASQDDFLSNPGSGCRRFLKM